MSNSPRRASRSAVQQEDAIEGRLYSLHPAGDSEDEMEEEEGGEPDPQLILDQIENQFDNLAVVGEEDDETLPPPLFGSPEGWSPPTEPPKDWKPKQPRNGEPPFNEVDNPGNWSEFTYQPKFKSGVNGQYLYHALPTGCTPVPCNAEGKRVVDQLKSTGRNKQKEKVGEFEFFTVIGTMTERRIVMVQHEENPLRRERKGKLCRSTLIRLGLTTQRMKEDDGAPDALFFYQLLLPVINPKRSGIEEDPRLGFYHHCALWSNLYACRDLDTGNGYGHNIRKVSPAELLKWDGVIVTDGSLGGSNGAILRRFDTSREDNLSYCKPIADAFSKTRFLEVKRVYKLCDNSLQPSKGEDGYDPAFKYDYIFKTIIHNVNALTERASLDQTIDETTFGHMGFGPSDGSNLLKRLKGKMVTKGCQIVVTSDYDRIRPRAYLHRHRLHDFEWSLEGPSEVKFIYEQLLPLIYNPAPAVQDENVDPRVYKPRPIFSLKPHFTTDNHFSGDCIMEYAAQQKFGITTTCRRDRLPSGIESKFFHKEKTNVQTKRTRAARWEHPVCAVKKVHGSTIAHVSFQSTSSCNIATVNSLNKCSLFSQTKQRGRGEKKRQWGIEMNEARQLYLNTYGRIDVIDHMMENCKMFYRSWKYWHMGMNHGKKLAVVTAYDFYLECCEGKIEPEWQVEKPVDFHRFREKLGVQMLSFSPPEAKYSGDEHLRDNTKLPIKRRKPQLLSPSRSVCSANSGVSFGILEARNGQWPLVWLFGTAQ